jgi:hypothetical protein
VAVSTAASTSRTPSAAWDGVHVGVVWVESPVEPPAGTAGVTGMNAYFTLLGPDASRALVSDIALTSVAPADWGVVGTPHVAWNGTEYAVVWRQRSPSTASEWISLLRIGPDGVPKGSAVDITAATAGGVKMGAYSPRIAWSPQYGGYAIAGTTGTQIQLQRLGATGASPTTVTAVSIVDGTPAYMNRVALAVSPTQQWGVLARRATALTLYVFNADGSFTLAPIDLETANVTGLVDLVHDGTDFHSTWSTAVDSPTQVTMVVWHNRGMTRNAPYKVFDRGGPPNLGFRFSDAHLTRDTWALAFGTFSDMYGDNYMRFLPNGTGSDLLDIGPPTTIASGAPIVAEATEYVQAGTTSMVLVWVDKRGTSYDLYARAMMLDGCP